MSNSDLQKMMQLSADCIHIMNTYLETIKKDMSIIHALAHKIYDAENKDLILIGEAHESKV